MNLIDRMGSGGGLTPNRVGRSVEYKYGHHYLTITDWGDGHCEIEIHRCIPKGLFHSCDMKDLGLAKQLFLDLHAEERMEVEEQYQGRIVVVAK